MFILENLDMRQWAEVINNTPNDKELIETVPQDIIFKYMDDCTKHILGVDHVNIKDDEAIVLVILKNGAHYVDQFMQHYNDIGIKHFFFLDNGSDDETISKLMNYSNVSIFQTDLTYRKFWNLFKRFLLHKFGKNKWNLVVDIDELFDYPLSNTVSFSQFLTYLNKNNYQAVVTQMLDMFPKEGVIEANKSSTNFKSTHCYYDNVSLATTDYHNIVPSNAVSNQNIKFHQGGVRKKVFGLDTIFISKHCLIKYETPIIFEHDHYIINGRIADVSAIILHYKFYGDFVAYVDEAIASGVHWNNSFQYKKYKEIFDIHGDILLYSDQARKLDGIDQLIEEKFLIISDNFLNFSQNLDLSSIPTNNKSNSSNDFSLIQELIINQDKRYRYFVNQVLIDNGVIEKTTNQEDPKVRLKLDYNRNKVKELEQHSNAIEKSYSYKIGRKITRVIMFLIGWIPAVRKRFP